MTNRCILLWVVIWCAITITAQARLGDNEVACATRYNHGQDVASISTDRHYPLLTGIHTTNKTYQYQGWVIRIGFMRGIAHRLQYRHQETMRKITEEEVNAILDANGGLSAWKPEPKSNYSSGEIMVEVVAPSMKAREWNRQDGARATLTQKTLHLDSAAYLRWKEERSKPKAKPIPSF